MKVVVCKQFAHEFLTDTFPGGTFHVDNGHLHVHNDETGESGVYAPGAWLSASVVPG